MQIDPGTKDRWQGRARRGPREKLVEGALTDLGFKIVGNRKMPKIFLESFMPSREAGFIQLRGLHTFF